MNLVSLKKYEIDQAHYHCVQSLKCLIFFPGMAARYPDAVILDSAWHQFRSFSELKNESRGGYLEGKIIVPDNVSTIRISLATHCQPEESHVNLLFVTPKIKAKKLPKCKEMRPKDHEVILKRNPRGFSCEPEYWSDVKCLAPGSFKDGILYLGKNGLQLTICKAVQKGQKSKIAIDKMLDHHEMKAFIGEIEKAKLKVIFDDLPPEYSKVILDKNKFYFNIKSIETPFLCAQNDQLLTIAFSRNTKITRETNLKLTLSFDIKVPEQNVIEIANFVHKDFYEFEIMSENVVKFKVNVNGHDNYNEAYVIVTVDDPEIDSLSYLSQIDQKYKILIQPHHQSKNSHPKCYCEIFSVSRFRKTVVRKRRRPNFNAAKPSKSRTQITVVDPEDSEIITPSEVESDSNEEWEPEELPPSNFVGSINCIMPYEYASAITTVDSDIEDECSEEEEELEPLKEIPYCDYKIFYPEMEDESWYPIAEQFGSQGTENPWKMIHLISLSMQQQEEEDRKLAEEVEQLLLDDEEQDFDETSDKK